MLASAWADFSPFFQAALNELGLFVRNGFGFRQRQFAGYPGRLPSDCADSDRKCDRQGGRTRSDQLGCDFRIPEHLGSLRRSK
ncbi:hypothetical protein QW131_23035 [Roseibium salinum]|nr:hypothetical protein [Roseibium salinum]